MRILFLGALLWVTPLFGEWHATIVAGLAPASAPPPDRIATDLKLVDSDDFGVAQRAMFRLMLQARQGKIPAHTLAGLMRQVHPKDFQKYCKRGGLAPLGRSVLFKKTAGGLQMRYPLTLWELGRLLGAPCLEMLFTVKELLASFTPEQLVDLYGVSKTDGTLDRKATYARLEAALSDVGADQVMKKIPNTYSRKDPNREVKIKAGANQFSDRAARILMQAALARSHGVPAPAARKVSAEDAKKIQSLVDLLADDPKSAASRSKALESLRTHGDNAIPALERVIRTSTDWRQVTDAFKLLEERYAAEAKAKGISLEKRELF